MPLDEPEGRRLGVISVDDPRDRLLPTRARLQALRLFANQAVAALQTADRAVRLRHEALHDPLTGLPNRRAFRARLSREAGRSDDDLALILCDMDNLKRVNDQHGHDAGDRALKALADALRTGLRRSDDAFRIGGDEFAVVLGGASRLDAERVAHRLQTELAAARAAGRGHPGELRHRGARARRGDGPARRARRPAALPREAPPLGRLALLERVPHPGPPVAPLVAEPPVDGDRAVGVDGDPAVLAEPVAAPLERAAVVEPPERLLAERRCAGDEYARQSCP